MENFLHGKCVAGNCVMNCQKFISEFDSRTCVDCGHKDSQHVILAVMVTSEGFRLLPKTDVDVPAAELKERIAQFSRAKATSNASPSVKAVG